MDTIFYIFKEDLEYLNYNSVFNLFKEMTKKNSPLFEMNGYDIGCHISPTVDKDHDVIAIDFSFFLMDNDFKYHYLDIKNNRYYLCKDFNQFITEILQEIYTRYNIDVWKSLKSNNYYETEFAYA